MVCITIIKLLLTPQYINPNTLLVLVRILFPFICLEHAFRGVLCLILCLVTWFTMICSISREISHQSYCGSVTLLDLCVISTGTLSFKVASLSLKKSHNYLTASGADPKDMGNIFPIKKQNKSHHKVNRGPWDVSSETHFWTITKSDIKVISHQVKQRLW